MSPQRSQEQAAPHLPVHGGPSAGADAVARERLQSLVHLARTMAEPRSIDDLVEVAAHEIRFALDAATVTVSRLERERGVIRVMCNVGDLAPFEQVRPADETYRLVDFPLLTRLIEDARPYRHDGVMVDADDREVELLTRLGKAFSLGSPILVDGRVWGELYSTRTAEQGPFDDDDVALVEALAAVMASGVAQASRVSLVERLAYEDPLTGLANRRAVDLRLEEALDARATRGGAVSVVMADVNGLKQVNDERGHEAGDRVLKSVADAISIAVSRTPSGLAGRIGGDEFCVVLDGLDAEQAVRVAQSIVDRLDEGPYAGALSCGVASTSLVGAGEPVTARQLLRWADEAQYAAKRARMRTPVLAGRDTLLVEPTERRSLRVGRPGRGGADRNGSVDRALADGLETLATAGTDPQLRAVRLLDALCDATGATGWVLSRLEPTDDDPAVVRTRTVAFAQAGESARPEVAATLPAEWVEHARRTGLVDRTGEATARLADARTAPVVAAAVVDDWLLELLGGRGAAVDGVAGALRALATVAVHG